MSATQNFENKIGSVGYDAHLKERLKDPLEAAAYLEAAIEEDDDGFLMALRDVADAHGTTQTGQGS